METCKTFVKACEEASLKGHLELVRRVWKRWNEYSPESIQKTLELLLEKRMLKMATFFIEKAKGIHIGKAVLKEVLQDGDRRMAKLLKQFLNEEDRERAMVYIALTQKLEVTQEVSTEIGALKSDIKSGWALRILFKEAMRPSIAWLIRETEAIKKRKELHFLDQIVIAAAIGGPPLVREKCEILCNTREDVEKVFYELLKEGYMREACSLEGPFKQEGDVQETVTKLLDYGLYIEDCCRLFALTRDFRERARMAFILYVTQKGEFDKIENLLGEKEGPVPAVHEAQQVFECLFEEDEARLFSVAFDNWKLFQESKMEQSVLAKCLKATECRRVLCKRSKTNAKALLKMAYGDDEPLVATRIIREAAFTKEELDEMWPKLLKTIATRASTDTLRRFFMKYGEKRDSELYYKPLCIACGRANKEMANRLTLNIEIPKDFIWRDNSLLVLNALTTGESEFIGWFFGSFLKKFRDQPLISFPHLRCICTNSLEAVQVIEEKDEKFLRFSINKEEEREIFTILHRSSEMFEWFIDKKMYRADLVFVEACKAGFIDYVKRSLNNSPFEAEMVRVAFWAACMSDQLAVAQYLFNWRKRDLLVVIPHLEEKIIELVEQRAFRIAQWLFTLVENHGHR